MFKVIFSQDCRKHITIFTDIPLFFLKINIQIKQMFAFSFDICYTVIEHLCICEFERGMLWITLTKLKKEYMNTW